MTLVMLCKRLTLVCVVTSMTSFYLHVAPTAPPTLPTCSTCLSFSTRCCCCLKVCFKTRVGAGAGGLIIGLYPASMRKGRDYWGPGKEENDGKERGATLASVGSVQEVVRNWRIWREVDTCWLIMRREGKSQKINNNFREQDTSIVWESGRVIAEASIGASVRARARARASTAAITKTGHLFPAREIPFFPYRAILIIYCVIDNKKRKKPWG